MRLILLTAAVVAVLTMAPAQAQHAEVELVGDDLWGEDYCFEWHARCSSDPKCKNYIPHTNVFSNNRELCSYSIGVWNYVASYCAYDKNGYPCGNWIYTGDFCDGPSDGCACIEGGEQ